MAQGVRGGLQAADQVRRWQGWMLDGLGLGPIETPSRVVLARPAMRLRAYAPPADRERPAGDGAVALLVPAPIKRAYIWDLVPWASVVRRCLDAGMRPYLLEWREPGLAERNFGLAEYADRFIRECLDAIETETGRCDPVIVGHSLGGTLGAIFAAANPGLVRALVLLEAPLHFPEGAGAFAPLLALGPSAGFVQAVLGNIPGTFLDAVSIAAAPGSFEWDRWLDWIDSSQDRLAWQTHVRVERWTLDEMPLPGRLFEEIVEGLYRGDRLMQGTLTVNGRRAAPDRLDMPLLSVIDPRSPIIPPDSVLDFHEAAASPDKQVLRYEGDRGVALQHVGVLVGASAHETLWPEILGWVRERWNGR